MIVNGKQAPKEYTPTQPYYVFNKLICDEIEKLRKEGTDAFPGIDIIQSEDLPIMVNSNHPFQKYKS